MPLLERGAHTIGELHAHAELASFDVARLRDAVLHLLLGERISPLQNATSVPAKLGALRVASSYNRWILQRGFAIEVPIVVTSPTIGNGIRLTMTEAAGLYLALENDEAKRAEWVRTFCEDSLTHLMVRGHMVRDKRELAAIVVAEAERFRETRLPKMVELGVVEAG
jgi:hypothetical protein